MTEQQWIGILLILPMVPVTITAFVISRQAWFREITKAAKELETQD
jgi:hypothetical protein